MYDSLYIVQNSSIIWWHSPPSETGYPKLEKHRIEESSSGSDCHKHLVTTTICFQACMWQMHWNEGILSLYVVSLFFFSPCRCLLNSQSSNPEMMMMPLCCTRGQPEPGGTRESFQWKRMLEIFTSKGHLSRSIGVIWQGAQKRWFFFFFTKHSVWDFWAFTQ